MQNNSEAHAQEPAPASVPTAEQTVRNKKSFPSVGDLFALLGIAFAAQIVVGVAGILYAAFTDGGADLAQWAPKALGGYMAVTYFVSMALALWGMLRYRRVRGGTGRVAQSSLRGLDPVLLLWSCVFMFAAGVVLEPALSLLPQPSVDMGRGFWAAVTLIVFAPLFEEVMCRGVVLGAVRAKYGVVPAWLLSSLFFAVLHLQPLLVVNAFVIGLILGFIYIATGSIWASVLLHAANNAIAYTLMAAGHGETMLIDLVGSRTWYVVIFIAAAAVTVVSARMVWSALKRLKQAEKKPQEA